MEILESSDLANPDERRTDGESAKDRGDALTVESAWLQTLGTERGTPKASA